jgi:hypothetical protein
MTQADVIYEVRPRAAFDLNCPADEIRITAVSGDAHAGVYHAKGCGLEADYFMRCPQYGYAERCRVESAKVED